MLAEDAYHQLVNVATGQSLQLLNPNVQPGNAVTGAASQRIYSQSWALTASGAGTVFLTNRHNHLALSAPGTTAAAGAAVDFARPLMGVTAQQWSVAVVRQPDTTAPAPGTGGTGGTGDTTGGQPAPSQPAPAAPSVPTVVSTKVSSRGGRRTVIVRVRATQRTDVRLRLVRKGVTLAQDTVKVRGAGSKQLELAVPARVPAGGAVLEVRFRQASGTVVTQKVRISVEPVRV